MNKPLNLINVLAGLLLSITCGACGRAAVTPQPRQDAELRATVLDVTDRASNRDTDGTRFEDPADARILRRTADDSSLEQARAARSGWAASGAR